MWSIHPPPVVPLSIHLRSLLLLWAMVLQMMWQGAWMPTSLREGRGKCPFLVAAVERRGGDGGVDLLGLM